MTDWLSEHEDIVNEVQPDDDNILMFTIAETRRMARVLREQSAVLGNGPWDFVGGDVVGGGYKCRYCQVFLKAYLAPDGVGPIDFMERHKKDCIWRKLSDDAKALLKVEGTENGK